MNFLFVCSANKDRSKTADDYFSEMYPHHHFDSAGTNINICRKLGTNEITQEIIQWADLIFVMESKHQAAVQRMSKSKAQIINLNIPDRYQYNSKELIQILKSKIDPSHFE